MERYEAIKLIYDRLPEIIEYLDELKSRLEPAFNRYKLEIFDVGVNVVETATRDSIDYAIKVYTTDEKVKPESISDIVKVVEPDYHGTVSVSLKSVPYPTNSLLGLDLLKDMHKMFS
ncbi:MAG: hypothetical protein ACMXYG_07190 [Candidatus Woesearchaeota archaeon]